MSILFKNARLINPAQNLDMQGSIKVSETGMIETITFGDESISSEPNDSTIDMSGKIIASGLFDMHCHFREPGQEYKETLETGSRAAVAGGFTGVAVMPNTKPVIDSPLGAAFIKHNAKDLPIDIEIIAAMTEGSAGEKLSPYGKLCSYGVRAISDDGTAVQTSRMMRLIFEYAASFGLLMIQHCEDTSLSSEGIMNEGGHSALLGLKGIPDVAEIITLARDINLMEYLQKHKLNPPVASPRYHVAHISTAGTLDLVRQAKAKGMQVTCEVTPHHFTLTEQDLYDAEDKGNFIMKPPLCSKENHEAILEGLSDGTIDAIACDHAPHARHEKECPADQAAFGIIGLETSVGLTLSELVHTGKITLYRAIELLSSNPRKIMGLTPILFEPGSPANFTFIDPEETWTYTEDLVHSKSRNTPFLNRTMKGRALGIYHKGMLHGLG
ncbi:dihydroorotase [Prosthecochloris sp.]|uniref:dihydroorotase n=1 Tax=Prosthecochloris sp. TaxID=290513 RepID=UPI0025DCFDDC|nr:dihydroorotase [Prosthecochloris sp.]